MLRTAVWRELRWPRLAAGASVLLVDRRVVASGWHPFDFQIKTLREVRLRASRSYGQVPQQVLKALRLVHDPRVLAAGYGSEGSPMTSWAGPGVVSSIAAS